MSLILTAKEQIEIFDRPSAKVSKALIERVEQLEKENAELKTELEDTYALYQHGDIYIDGKSLAEHDRQVITLFVSYVNERSLTINYLNIESFVGKFLEQLKEQ